MSKNLVIVESPAKAKTIEKYLGADFTVKSSFGHVRDLPKSNDAIDVNNNFKPNYEVTDDKKKVVKELQDMVKQVDTVWLASDDDREGEAISWHLYETLGLHKKDTKRIVFREITKNAILKAIQNPRNIDIDLVNAQQARRILDRLVGFEISPVLWKKVKSGLSAGRVQSVAMRMIVEREREIDKFNTKGTFKISADFLLAQNKKLNAELSKNFEQENQALDFLQKCIGAEFYIKNLETKPAKKSPAAPFTTSTLQQEASRKLYFSVAQTMSVAQKLYEAGRISYMRTDSTNLSEEALQNAAQEITSEFGKDYHQKRTYKSNNENAQEAHEAIRPTDFSVHSVTGDKNEQRLYDLIWKRAIASQMSDALLERTTATVGIAPTLYNQQNPKNIITMPDLVAKGEVIRFDGFLKVYLESKDDQDEEDENTKMLPPLTIGQDLNLAQMRATERFSRPAPRYTEASLVKELEEQGIGRPSTYAPTISTIQQRGYVVKEDREGKKREYKELLLEQNKISESKKSENFGAEKSKLFPTDIAGVVNDFLLAHFDDIVDYSFTAQVEKKFDLIAEGKQDWVKMIGDFYKGFHEKVIETAQTAERANAQSKRILGTHPDNGQEVFVTIGRYGAYVQIGENPADEKSKEKPPRASIRKDQRLETITLPEALELFKLPRESGEFEGKKMKVAIGKFGPYIAHDSKFYSLPKEDDPFSVNETRCIEIIEAKRLADSQKTIKHFNDNVQVLNGRYGAYIKFGDQNVKIPKDINPQDLTLDKCTELAQAQSTVPKTTTKKGGWKKK